MSFFQRVKLILSSNINAIISKAEDPEKILEQLIIEMREQFAEAKKQVAATIADEKRLERQYTDESAKAQEWEKKAMLAVRAGNDDLARKALLRKQEHDGIAAGFKTQWDAQKDATEKLKQALHQLNDKIEEARRKKDLLIARSKRAEAQKKIHNTMSGLTDNGAFDTFERMAAKVEQKEAEGLASVELLHELSGSDLDSQFKQLEASSKGDDLLAALKSKMGTSQPAALPAAVAPIAAVEADPLDAELERLKALTEGRMPAGLEEVSEKDPVVARP
ncbi:MAG: hypothetical protein AMXMBFR64_32260 [Myxococcales bacterium]